MAGYHDEDGFPEDHVDPTTRADDEGLPETNFEPAAGYGLKRWFLRPRIEYVDLSAPGAVFPGSTGALFDAATDAAGSAEDDEAFFASLRASVSDGPRRGDMTRLEIVPTPEPRRSQLIEEFCRTWDPDDGRGLTDPPQP